MKAYRNILAVLLAIVVSFSFPCISFALDDTAVQEVEVKTVEERAEEISTVFIQLVVFAYIILSSDRIHTDIRNDLDYGLYL